MPTRRPTRSSGSPPRSRCRPPSARPSCSASAIWPAAAGCCPTTASSSTQAALAAARRIDAVRLTLERVEQRVRQEEMERLAAEAELRALRAQINPHFLFNALTTIGYLIEAAPPRATVDAAAPHLAAAQRAALRGRVDDARPRSRAGRALPGDRARAVRGAAPRRHRRPAGAAPAAGALPDPAAAGRERRQARRRPGDARRRGAGRGAARRRRAGRRCWSWRCATPARRSAPIPTSASAGSASATSSSGWPDTTVGGQPVAVGGARGDHCRSAAAAVGAGRRGGAEARRALG